MLRPSVQLPAGIHGCARYKDFGLHGKDAGHESARMVPVRAARSGSARPRSALTICLYDIQISQRAEYGSTIGTETAPEARRPAIPSTPRGPRARPGAQMRSLLLDGASRLFKERGLAGTSISDIAAAADAFPSQITYYFRTKEALFVEAACRDVLYVARAAEQAALQARTPRDYTRALVETVTATDSVAFFAEALTLTRRRQDLAPLVERTIERLHGEGVRAYAGQIERHGWRTPARSRCISSRRFWAVAIGVILEGYAMGRSPEELCSRDAARARRAGDDKPAARRGCVSSASGDSIETNPNEEESVMTALRMRARDFLSEDRTGRRARARRPGRASR